MWERRRRKTKNAGEWQKATAHKMWIALNTTLYTLLPSQSLALNCITLLAAAAAAATAHTNTHTLIHSYDYNDTTRSVIISRCGYSTQASDRAPHVQESSRQGYKLHTCEKVLAYILIRYEHKFESNGMVMWTKARRVRRAAIFSKSFSTGNESIWAVVLVYSCDLSDSVCG